MNLVNKVTVNNKVIEYTPKVIERKDSNYLIYNNYNDKTISANKQVLEHLKSNSYLEKEDPLYSFLENKKKINLLDFKILNFLINTKHLNIFQKFPIFTTNTYIVFLGVVLTLITITIKTQELIPSEQTYKSFNPSIIITVYILHFIITILHELSHYYYYNLYFKPDYIRFGISLRYVVLLLFFTNVPFIDVMNKQSKKDLILAGIKTQLTLQGLLSIFILFQIQNDIVIILFILNLGNILINTLPFFKLDGYWYLSTILNTESYMSYYRDMLTKKEKFVPFIFFIGTLNIILIIFLILYTLSNVLSFLNII